MQRRPPPPKLLDIETADNLGEEAWRSRQPPLDTMRIPEELAMQRYHETAARQHGAFVFWHDENRAFGIWGEKAAVAATKKAILDWIEDAIPSQKAARAAKFAKIASLTDAQSNRAEKKWKREVTRQRYRQHPPPDMPFGAIGSFLWPVEEYRPEEVLGPSYEALDPIRMDCSCYVVFSRERKIFRIMGKYADVQQALVRIRQTCFQIAARQLSAVRTYLLRWTGSKVCKNVIINAYSQTVSSAGNNPNDEICRSPRGIGLHQGTTDQ